LRQRFTGRKLTVAPLEPPNRYGAGTRVSSCMSQTALGAFAYRSELGIADGDPVESTLRVVARLPERGLADFIRDFDAGKYPELLERSP
jgi:hypothetical protein